MSDVISELIMRVSELEKRLANVCRIARVIKVHETEAKLDISFEGLEREKVPFQTMRAGEDQTYWLPSVGELGFLFSPSGDIANAIFVPGIYFKDFPAGDSTTQKSKRIFRDGMVEEIDVDAHSQKFTSGDSERFIDSEKIEDKQGTSTIKIDGDETEINRTEGSIKIDSSEIEIKRSSGKIEVVVGTTKLEVSATAIKGFIAGVGKISVTATTVNVGGATFTAGATNLLGNLAAPITYVPIPIS